MNLNEPIDEHKDEQLEEQSNEDDNLLSMNDSPTSKKYISPNII